MPGTPVTTLTLETIDRYRQWCIGRGRSENTVKAYTSDLRAFLKAVGEDMVSSQEYEELAMAWLNMTRQQAAPRTTNRRLTSLKSFARWAQWPPVLEDYIAPTPDRGIPHPIPEGMDGIRRMIKVAKNYDQIAIVVLGGMMGLRISEILSCTADNFDLDNMLLTVRGKGDKTRVVPISPEAWSHLAELVVIAYGTEDKRLVNYQDAFARRLVTIMGKRAKLKRPIASHDLRSTFATEALNKTQNIRVVQELLGHASSTTTEIYTGVRVAQMRAAIQFD